MKHHTKFYALFQTRGTCGYQQVRLVSGDSQEHAIGFDTKKAAEKYIYCYADRLRTTDRCRNISVEKCQYDPNLFFVKYESMNSYPISLDPNDRTEIWVPLCTNFKIEQKEFSLFTTDEVENKMVLGY